MKVYLLSDVHMNFCRFRLWLSPIGFPSLSLQQVTNGASENKRRRRDAESCDGGKQLHRNRL